MELTPSQQHAYHIITTTLPEKLILLLYGAAGTGKSKLTQLIVNHFNHLNICCIAPTHKAKRVLLNFINQDRFVPITGMTVCSALSKIKEHSYIGTHVYTTKQITKLSQYQFFILDEVSMVHDKDLSVLLEFTIKHQKMLLIIGDKHQIPSPSAQYVITDTIEKADSAIFTSPVDKCELKEIIRQTTDSPILKLGHYICNNLDFNIMDTEYPYIIPMEDIYRKQQEYKSKIIAYTNAAVNFHNKQVRLHYTEPFMLGESLMGYQNLGYPELIIENGQDYDIGMIKKTETFQVSQFTKLVGWLINLVTNDKVLNALFFIDLNHVNNQPLLKEMIKRAIKVNAVHSSKLDFKRYNELKFKVLCMEDIYYYNQVYVETTFREKHPLLFTNINEVIVNNNISSSQLTDKIEALYPGLLQQRLDDNKLYSDSELLADQYKVIEKDLNYGYAITAHRAQGSTYESVIVDYPDFNKIHDRWHYKYNKLEIKQKEKNQLLYVAVTRAKSSLFIAN